MGLNSQKSLGHNIVTNHLSFCYLADALVTAVYCTNADQTGLAAIKTRIALESVK